MTSPLSVHSLLNLARQLARPLARHLPLRPTPAARWKSIILLAIGVASGACLSGCASQSAPQASFDLGSVTAPAPALPADSAAQVPGSVLAALSVSAINVPAWMDSTDMLYRLNYSDRQQLRPYANSRWSMPPAALLSQRLKWRIAAAGGAVLSPADNRLNILQIDAVDFSQSFDTPTSSQVQVALRVTLLSGHRLIAQKSFVQTAVSEPDAAGSARALAQASDDAIGAVLSWLAAQPLNK